MNRKKRIPRIIKHHLALTGKISDNLIAHGIIQGVVLVGLIILFGTLDNENVFSASSMASVIAFSGYLIAAVLYFSNLLKIKIKMNDYLLNLFGYVFSPFSFVVQFIFSSVFISFYYKEPFWETHLNAMLNSTEGILIGLFFVALIFYILFFQTDGNIIDSDEYFEKLNKLIEVKHYNSIDDVELALERMILTKDLNLTDTNNIFKDSYIAQELQKEDIDDNIDDFVIESKNITEQLPDKTKNKTKENNPLNIEKTVRSKR